MVGMKSPIILHQFFSNEEIGRIVALQSDGTFENGEVMTSRQSNLNTQVRVVRTLALNPDNYPWLTRPIYDAVVTYNDGWHDITHVSQMNLLKYDFGGKYNWHADVNWDMVEAPQRKYTVVVQLSDRSEYEGGELQLRGHSPHAMQPKGTMIIFPSNLNHRVTPVTSGRRWSLITWINGPYVPRRHEVWQ